MATLAPDVGRPWLRIWRHPRAAIRGVLEGQAPALSWLLLAAVSGVAQTLVRGAGNNVGARGSLLVILGVSLLVGVVWGVVQLYLFTALLYVVGRWSGNKATFRGLRTVVAWSQVPQVVVAVCWLLAAVLFGRGIFRDPEFLGPGDLLIALAIFSLSLVTLACIVWTLVILVNGLAEAQGISGAMAVFHVIGAALIFGVAVLVLMVPIMLLTFRQ